MHKLHSSKSLAKHSVLE